MYRVLRIIFFLPIVLLMPCKIVGAKNIDKKGKVILAINHLTLLDVVILIIYLKRRIYFVGKKELFKNKFVKWFFKKMGVIPIDRENMDIATVKSIIQVLKDEHVLGIFPEGTRNKSDDVLLDFKDGTTLFAERTGAPVVPIIIKRKPRLFVPNKVVIGEKIYFEKNNLDNTKNLRDIMYEMRLKELRKNGKNDKRND